MGWKNESKRHSLARKGIKTAQKLPNNLTNSKTECELKGHKYPEYKRGNQCSICGKWFGGYDPKDEKKFKTLPSSEPYVLKRQLKIPRAFETSTWGEIIVLRLSNKEYGLIGKLYDSKYNKQFDHYALQKVHLNRSQIYKTKDGALKGAEELEKKMIERASK